MRTFKYLLVGMAGIIGAASACGGGNDNSAACVQGALNCLCRPNSGCDLGLQCSNNVCVASNNPGSGGQSGNSTAPNANGGTSESSTLSNGNGGTTAASATSDGNGGTQSATSTNATGGASNTSSSAAATGGSQSCTNTATDAKNCGGCGHECKSGSCADGKCVPARGPCFDSSSSYTNCVEACSGKGQTCVAAGCGNYTLWGWATKAGCDDQTTPVGRSSGGCEQTIQYTQMTYVRCCCVDK